MAASKPFTIHHAAELKAPLSSSRPVFYTHTLCPYAQRVFLTLLCKGMPFELVQVDLSDKPRWYRGINPSGLVPAVVYQDKTYVESLDICRWIDDTFRDPPMTPAEVQAQRHMQDLLSRTSGIVSAGLDLVSGSTARSWGVGTKPSRSHCERFEGQCQHLAAALDKLGGPYLVGPSPSLADVALLPFFERFELSLQLFQGYDIAKLHGGAVSQWMDNMHRFDWCKLAAPDAQKFGEALRTHQSLDFFDYTAYTAYQVHPHLQHISQ